MPSLFVYASLLLGGGIEGPAPAANAPSVLVVVGAPARKNTASSSANGPSAGARPPSAVKRVSP